MVKKMYVVFLFFLCSALICSCSTKRRVEQSISPLKGYIRAHKYEPFEIPRSGSGVGILASYPNRTEQIEAERTDCLPEEKIPATTRDAALSSYSLSSSSSVESNIFAYAISNSRLNLEAAFKDDRVKSVKISFVKPFEEWITPTSIELYSQADSMSQVCFDKLFDPDNYVILRVLGAEKVSFAFLTAEKTNLKLDAKFLKNIGFDLNASPSTENQLELKTEKRMILGYRLWQIEPAEALAGSKLKTLEIALPEIIKLKKQ